jgi:hypothetical protein
MSTTNETLVRPYTNKELAALYGVSGKTLRTWLQAHKETIGDRAGRYYTSLQIRTIFHCLGSPN